MSNTLPPGATPQRRWGLGSGIDYLRRFLTANHQQEQAAAQRRAVGARNVDDVLAGLQAAAHALEETVALIRQERAEDRHHVDDLARRVRALEERRG